MLSPRTRPNEVPVTAAGSGTYSRPPSRGQTPIQLRPSHSPFLPPVRLGDDRPPREASDGRPGSAASSSSGVQRSGIYGRGGEAPSGRGYAGSMYTTVAANQPTSQQQLLSPTDGTPNATPRALSSALPVPAPAGPTMHPYRGQSPLMRASPSRSQAPLPLPIPVPGAPPTYMPAPMTGATAFPAPPLMERTGSGSTRSARGPPSPSPPPIPIPAPGLSPRSVQEPQRRSELPGRPGSPYAHYDPSQAADISVLASQSADRLNLIPG